MAYGFINEVFGRETIYSTWAERMDRQKDDEFFLPGEKEMNEKIIYLNEEAEDDIA
jgi:hypothetical protein